MYKRRKIILMPLVLLLSAGCVQTVKETTPIASTSTNNPNSVPIATAYPIATQPIYTPSQPIYQPQQPIYQPQQPIYQPQQPVYSPPQVITQPIITEPAYIPPRSTSLQGAYGRNYKLKQFISTMARKHNYDQYQLNSIFSTVSRDTISLDKYNVYKTAKPSQSKATKIGSWDKYRGNFLTPSRIKKGVAFWKENANYLNKAYQQYGIPPEYIVGIIGVETNFGGYTGKHSVLNALTTLALEYKKRSKFFTSELENYLLMIRDEKVHPQKIKGSYAGAFGLAQFMPSSFREYAVDFNGDGHINLFNKADAIGSIANYFVGRGKWQMRVPVTMKTYYNKARFYGLPTGHKTSYTQGHMKQVGMRPTSSFNGYKGNVSLIKLSRYERDEMWWGTPNFRAITRYNPRDHYAMAVHQLSLAIRKARYGR